MHFSTSAGLGALALFTAAGNVAAHMGKGVPHNFKVREVLQPGSGAMTPIKRAPSATVSNEPSAATNTNAAQECTAYYVEALSAISSSFPTVWETATIVSGDTEANSVWTAIQNSGIIPSDVAQKGTGGKGDFTGITYSASSDPDCWWTESNCVTPKHKGIPDDIWQCAEPDTWGLTFDDGPNCSHNAFYDFLQTQNQKATLFYIGSNVMDWPLEAERGIVEGHHVCVHTWSHQYMTQLTDEEVFAELYYTGKIIKDVTGVTPRCWRPPYGDVDDRVRAIATGLGMSTNLWSSDTDDWQVAPQGTEPTASIKANYNSIIGEDYSQHGNIVLTHEIDASTMELMIEMYPTIKQHFKYIVPITACMNITNPYPEDLTYPNFASYIAGSIMPSGLPSADAIAVSSASFNPVAVASQTGTLAQTASATGSSDSSDSSSSSNKKSSSSSSSSGTSSLSIQLTFLCSVAAALLACVVLL